VAKRGPRDASAVSIPGPSEPADPRAASPIPASPLVSIQLTTKTATAESNAPADHHDPRAIPRSSVPGWKRRS
jgi:hypothetical protein